MNNDELKKKILTIVRGAMVEADELPFIETTDNITDALIAAGLCNKNTLDEKYQTLMAAGFVQLASLRLDFEKVLHKAEVAEKALDLCETAYILSLNHRATEGISGQAIASDLGVHKFFMEQAEKELAEEETNNVVQSL